ncbi:MAG: hypothetical protein GTO60_16780 [Gammaproteobacteria bacterium]|nr:hypothetical protein [Gammaproteobacteria bacterium]
MAAPKRTKLQKEADLPIIAKLYLAGNLQSEIAAHISAIRDYTLTQQQISKDIAFIRRQWVKETTMALDEAKALELIKIDKAEREYWEAWEASKKPRKRTSKRGSDDVTMALEERTGDPRYLAGVMSCIQQRCKLLGIEAPQRTEHTGKDGDDLFGLLLSRLHGED